MSAHMIRPFHQWLWDVTRIEEICNLRETASIHSPFWWRCYRNNETPFSAVMHNYDWLLPSSKLRKLCEERIRKYEEFFDSPYGGIGDETQYVQFEY